MKSSRIKYKAKIIFMVLTTPFIAFLAYLLISVFTYQLSSTLPNEKYVYSITLILTGSLIIFLWYRFFKNNPKYSNPDKYNIFKVSEIINVNELTLNESKAINKTEGWDFDDLEKVYLTNNQIKEAHSLAVKSSIEEKKYIKNYRLILSIIAFLMALFGFAGVLPSRGGGDYPPVIAGSFCLVAGCLLLYSSIKK